MQSIETPSSPERVYISSLNIVLKYHMYFPPNNHDALTNEGDACNSMQ